VLSQAQADILEYRGLEFGRRGLANYLRLLVGGMIKVLPSGDGASESQATDNGLRVVCGATTAYLPDKSWVTEKNRYGGRCEIRVAPSVAVIPNLGTAELAEALGRVIPFTAKQDDRPVLACVRFAAKGGKLTLAAADGFRIADISLDFDGEGEALIEAKEIRGLISALKRAKRVRLAFEAETSATGMETKSLVIDTEAIRYRWESQSGSYPDYEKVIPTEFVAQARFDTREMMRAVAGLGALFLDKDAPIILTISDGKVRIWTREPQAEAHIEAEAQGEVETAMSASYLAQALKALGGVAEVKVASPNSPIIFSVDGYRLVVMPLAVPGIGSQAVTEAEAVADAASEAPEGEAETEAEAEAEAEAQAEPEGEAETQDKPRHKRKAKEPVAVA